MCLQIEIAMSPDPETARVAKAAFPKGNCSSPVLVDTTFSGDCTHRL